MNTELYIKDILKAKGITSKELASMLGKAPQYVSNIINGGKGASISTLEEISTALNVPMWQLFASQDEVQRVSVPSDFVAIIRCNGKVFTPRDAGELFEVAKHLAQDDGE